MTRRGLVFGFATLPVFAQSRQERGKKVVERAIAGLGGANFMGMEDRVEAGRAYSFYREQLSGLSHARIYTRYLTRPEPPRADFFGLRERQSFGKDKEDSASLFTEAGAWSITYRGARPIAREIVERFRDSTRRNVFYILRQCMGEPGLLIEHEGQDIVENQPVDIINFTDSENKVVRVFFHTSTGLPVRQEYVRRDEKTRDRFEEVTRFAKYREVKGVQWPYQIQRERDGEKIFEIFSENVRINAGLTDELFTLSAKIKILPPAR